MQESEVLFLVTNRRDCNTQNACIPATISYQKVPGGNDCASIVPCSPISWNSRHNASPLPGKQGSPLSQPVESRGLLSALLKNKRCNWHRFINRNWYMPGRFWYQMLQSWLVICMRKRRGITLTVLNFQEMVGMGGCIRTYIVGIGLET